MSATEIILRRILISHRPSLKNEASVMKASPNCSDCYGKSLSQDVGRHADEKQCEKHDHAANKRLRNQSGKKAAADDKPEKLFVQIVSQTHDISSIWVDDVCFTEPEGSGYDLTQSPAWSHSWQPKPGR